MQKGDISSLEQAAKEFDSIAGWKDSSEKANECRETIMKIKNDTAYDEAVQLMQSQDVSDLKKAATLLSSISGWKDADQLTERCEKLIISIPNDRLYEQALTLMQCNEINKLKQAVQSFESVSTWKDSSEKIEECQQMIQALQKNQAYDTAVKLMSKGKKRNLHKAMTAFSELKDWKDSEDLLCQCQEKLNEQQTKGTANADKRKTSFLRVLKVSVVAAALLMLAALTPKVIEYTEPKIAEYRYNKALTLIEEGQYEKSFPILEKLGDYSDAKEQLTEAKYALAVEYQNSGDYDSAVAVLSEVDGTIKSDDLDGELKYRVAKSAMEKEDYETAISIFPQIARYKDSSNLLKESRYLLGKQYIDSGKYQEAEKQFISAGGYQNSTEMIRESRYLLAKQYLDNKEYTKAVAEFKEIRNYKDSNNLFLEANYLLVKLYMEQEDYQSALTHLKQIRYTYKDTNDLQKECEYHIGLEWLETQQYDKAIMCFRAAGDYEDGKDLLRQCYYHQGLSYLDEKKYTLAITYFKSAEDYEDAPQKLAEAKAFLESEKAEKAAETARKSAEEKASREAAALQRAKNGYELTYRIYNLRLQNDGYIAHSLTAKLIENNQYQITLNCTLPQNNKLIFLNSNINSSTGTPTIPIGRLMVDGQVGTHSYTWTVDRDALKSGTHARFNLNYLGESNYGTWISFEVKQLY